MYSCWYIDLFSQYRVKLGSYRNQTTLMSLDWLYTMRMFFVQIVILSVGCKSTNSCEPPCYWVCLNCQMNKLSENVASVPVTGHSRKIEASAHLSKCC